MSEWWTYALSDFQMFSPQVYLRLFEAQNRAWWPAPVLAFLPGLVVLALMWRATARASRLAWTLAGTVLLFVAWSYFHQRYADIHLAGEWIAALFALQGGLLLMHGALRARIPLARSPSAWGGFALAVLALVIWPLLAPLAGRRWMQAELFALSPDPTAIATLGLLLAARATPWWLLPIPAVWLLFSGATVSTMGMPLAWVGPVVVLLVLAWLAAKPLLRNA